MSHLGGHHNALGGYENRKAVFDKTTIPYTIKGSTRIWSKPAAPDSQCSASLNLGRSSIFSFKDIKAIGKALAVALVLGRMHYHHLNTGGNCGNERFKQSNIKYVRHKPGILNLSSSAL